MTDLLQWPCMPRGIIQSIMSGSHIPTEIRLHQKSRLMEIVFADGCRFSLPYEFLRVHSPSAEVRGHGPGQQVLQTGKRDVTILSLEPVGTYAVQPVFSDRHATGIYAWNYLHFLGENRDRLWQEYLDSLATVGASRDPEVITGAAPAGAAEKGC